MRAPGFDPDAQPLRSGTSQPEAPQSLAPPSPAPPLNAQPDDGGEEEQMIEEPGYGHGV